MSAKPIPEDHLGLVWLEARRFSRRRWSFGLNDPDRDTAENFVASGFIGLAKACESFDPSRGVKFSTFALPRIRGSIIDGERAFSKARKGREAPQFSELTLSLIDPDPLPVDAVEIESVREAVRLVVDDPDLLTRGERLAIVRRYWHEERGIEIARRIHLTESRVSQLLASAHGKLFGALLPVVLAAPAGLLRSIQAKRDAKANRQPRRFKQKRCAFCGKAFAPTGPRALYCSGPCRSHLEAA